MEAFISKIEKKYHIYLIIIIAVVIYTSLIVLPYNAAGKTLHDLGIESNSIVQNVPSFNVGETPLGVDVDQSDNIAYVVNSGSNTVSVINWDTLKVSKITVGEYPISIAVNDLANIAYVANSGSNTVSVIKETDGVYSNIANVTVGNSPASIDTNDIHNIAYVVNRGSNTVSVIKETDGVYSNIANVTVGNTVYNTPESIAVNDIDKVTYVANSGSNTVSVIKETADGVYRNLVNVIVGNSPASIAVDLNNIVYVANSGSNTVSVIDGETLTVSNIKVGALPVSIDIDDSDNIAYVANSGSNTVSVIKETSDGVYSNVANVSVDSPYGIAVDQSNNIAYVANLISNVSVIKETDGVYSNIANVTVGNPASIAVYETESGSLAYVTNTDSNTVSVISSPSQKVQAGVSFDTNPFHAGRIECNNITVPTNQYFFVDFRTQCEAKANKGFQFNSWIENLEGNSSRTISSSTAPDFLDFLLNPLLNALSIGPKDTPAILSLTKFGSFTANFEELQPPLPPEYWGTLFSVVATALVGTWLIPSVIGWTRSKRQHRSLRQYRKRIKSLNNSKSDNKNERENPDKLKNNITTAYSRGEINELQHEILKEEILRYHQGAISKTIDLLKNMSDRNNDKYIQALDKTRIQIKDAYTEGKINNEHYTDLKNEISVLYDEIYTKRIDSLNSKQDRDDDSLLNQIKYDIEDAYAKGKITDQHYNLLNKKLESFVKKTSDNKTNHDNIGTANKTDISKRSQI